MRAIGIGQCSWDTLALVESYPGADTKAEALKWCEQGGGPVATACAALSALGAEARFMGVVGDDTEGRRIIASLESDGVDASGTLVREASSSQSAFIAVEQTTARRTIFWRRPTGEPLSFDELPEDFLEGAKMLMLDGLMNEVSMAAATRARDRGVPVMVDAGRVRQGMLELCALSDHVVGSEDFARGLGYRDGMNEADETDFFMELSSRFPGHLTITFGPAGSVTVSGGNVIRTPAYKVDAVDTTGAGDVFHAGYAYGVMSGWDIDKSVRFATVAAALSCRALGGRAALPLLGEALGALDEFQSGLHS